MNKQEKQALGVRVFVLAFSYILGSFIGLAGDKFIKKHILKEEDKHVKLIKESFGNR